MPPVLAMCLPVGEGAIARIILKFFCLNLFDAVSLCHIHCTTLSARFKISILWLWVVSLLSATVGISVHQIYCYCVGKTTFSIFDETADACAVQAVLPLKEACCSSAAPSCCSKEDSDTAKHDCTKKSVKVFQLKTEFLVGHPLDKVFDFPVWADEFPEFLKLYRPAICETAVHNKAPPVPPPPLSGRAICLRHELFLC